MKLFTANQIAEIDRLTIGLEKIESIDLMERASIQVSSWILHKFGTNQNYYFFAGSGNNGGDALAVARLLSENNCSCSVFLVSSGSELKGDTATNWQRLVEKQKVELKNFGENDPLPEIPAEVIVIDGLFGSGLNRPLNTFTQKLAGHINHSKARIVSIDLPSGLFCEDNTTNEETVIIRADYTLSFQFPKLSFFFPENEKFVGELVILPIGLHPEAILQIESKYFNLANTFVSGTIKKRSKFAHKGHFGHALIIAGSYGKMGAAILSSKACLRSGAGLLTCHSPKSGNSIVQISIPEAMTSIDDSETHFSLVPDLSAFSAIGIGPGLGTDLQTQAALKQLLQTEVKKLVLDADALNILSINPEWIQLLPENSILTPHPKEFERLAGASQNSFDRLQKQIRFSVNHKLIMVVKGAHTCITLPDGCAFFNSTGNPGMATAGSGDVLTGIILGLLAQDYSPEDAALLGVYIHGLAGDLAAGKLGQHALIAGDIIDYLGDAFKHLE